MCTPAQAHDALITQPHWQVGRRNLDVPAGKTYCDYMTDEPSGHRDGRRAKKKSTRGGDQSVLPDGLSCAVWSMFGVLEDAARRALQLQRLGWVIWVRVGLGQCSDGW